MMKALPRIPLLFLAAFGSFAAFADENAPAKPSRAAQIMVPKIAFKEATVHEAVEFLTKKSKPLDPEKTGITVTYAAPRTDRARVSIELKNTSLEAVVKKIAQTANLDLKVDGDVFTLSPKPGAKPAPVDPVPPGIPGLIPNLPKAPPSPR